MIFIQSEATAARCRFPLYLVDATDGITPETGEAAGQPQISKNGGSWVATTNTLTAIGNGSYYVELTSTELNTLGKIHIRYKSAATAEFSASADVVAFDVMVAAGSTTISAVSGAVGSVTGAVGSVTGSVGSVTGAVGSVTGLTAATVHADLDDIQTRLPAALVSGRIDASVGAMAANTVTAAAIAADAIGASELAADAATEIADAILARDIGSGTGAGSSEERTVRAALRFLRNKWSISGTTITVTKEDDTTAAWTSALTATPGANPITASDPT